MIHSVKGQYYCEMLYGIIVAFRVHCDIAELLKPRFTAMLEICANVRCSDSSFFGSWVTQLLTKFPV